MRSSTRPRVVIVGGGFGGLGAARTLAGADVDVTVVDRTNHHLFQPLLYQVALASLAPSDITAPIRFLLRRHRNVRVVLGNATHVDVERRVVGVDGGAAALPYDFLILAAGARQAYFDHDEWARFAPGLKSLEDAMEIRRRFLLAFEQAELTADERERRALLTMVVIGGGPTGVELAGMLPDVARALQRDFRSFDATQIRVVLVEGGPRILPTFPEALSSHAARDLEALGVELRTGTRVTHVDGSGVRVSGELIEARTVFWAAGNRASSLGQSLGVDLDASGRVLVERDLTVPGHPEIYVVGDLAAVRDTNGQFVPAVSPAATQMGQRAARNVIRSLRSQTREVFRYRNKGELATIGRHRAVANFPWFTVTGYAAWFFWLFVHILYLAGFRNRLSVLVQWGYMYLTYRRGVRLISAGERRPAPATGEWPAPSRPIAEHQEGVGG